ncbi:hypothetical protein [Anabaena sp. AL93]|jgi:peptidoglycan/LPS O-acetylase OafA/YrhL|nr:hypothetical protein [Anabaena sp. AL93]
MISLHKMNTLRENSNKLNSLQILRGIAALLVILAHGTAVAEKVFN